jgi:hypothetical protein
MTDLEACKELLARLLRREPVSSLELKRALGDEIWTDYQLRRAWVKREREEAKNASYELRDYVRLLRIADLSDAQPNRHIGSRRRFRTPRTSPSAKYEQALIRLSELVEQNNSLAQYLDRTFSPYCWDCGSDIGPVKEGVPRIVYHRANVQHVPEERNIKTIRQIRQEALSGAIEAMSAPSSDSKEPKIKRIRTREASR